MEIYEVTLKNMNKEAPLECVMIRTRTLTKTDAVITAETLAKPYGTFYIHHVIAGPKFDLSE